MKEFYKQELTRIPLNSLSPGKLIAVVGEEEEDILRGEVLEVKSDTVTVSLAVLCNNIHNNNIVVFLFYNLYISYC